MNNHLPLDAFEIDIPREMRSYLRSYGYNFNRKACDYAISRMKRLNSATGKREAIEVMDKEAVEELLKKNSIRLDHNEGHNFVYAANMIKTHYWKSSVKDEASMAQMIKDIIDDTDNEGGNLFRHWLTDCDAKCHIVDWEELL